MTAQWTAGLRLHAGAWIPWVAVGHLALLASLRLGGRRWMSGIVKAAAPTALALLMGEMFLAVMGVGLAAALLLVVQISEQREGHLLAISSSLGLGASARRGVGGGRGRGCDRPRSRGHGVFGARHGARSRRRRSFILAPTAHSRIRGTRVHGRRVRRLPAAPVVGEPRLDGLPLSYSVYMGASVIALALIAFRRRFIVIALGCLTGFALLVSLGKFLPLHAILRRLVPPLAFMRFPEKYLTLVVVGLALLAGLGRAADSFGRGAALAKNRGLSGCRWWPRESRRSSSFLTHGRGTWCMACATAQWPRWHCSACRCWPRADHAWLLPCSWRR
jgi:hypothetical protein